MATKKTAEKKASGRGGKREGAGRPRLGKETAAKISVALPQELLEEVDAYAAQEGVSRSAVIADALRVYFAG